MALTPWAKYHFDRNKGILLKVDRRTSWQPTLDVAGEEEDGALVEKEENMKTLIDECKKMLITEPEECLGSWGLIDADPV